MDSIQFAQVLTRFIIHTAAYTTPDCLTSIVHSFTYSFSNIVFVEKEPTQISMSILSEINVGIHGVNGRHMTQIQKLCLTTQIKYIKIKPVGKVGCDALGTAKVP